MDNNCSINLNNLSKIYKLYDTPLARLKESFHPTKKKYHREFHALNNISFSALQGEIVGIIGTNGSGKSTLLQIISGVLSPTSGDLCINGKISALLELGAGFNPEFTGLENVYFSSSIQGYSDKETEKNLQNILSFADIGEFINQPVKTYSSGMYVRLAFAVAINVDPDILIIDEALSVGDYRFRQKCLRKIREFKENGKTILLVSHDTGAVIEFCTKTIWLKDGSIEEIGHPSRLCKNYLAFMSQGEVITNNKPHINNTDNESCSSPCQSSGDIDWEQTTACSSFGKKGAEITGVSLYAKDGAESLKLFEGGERVVLYLKIHIKQTIESPVIGFHLSDVKGVHILGMNTSAVAHPVSQFEAGEVRIIEFEFYFPYLKTGTYSFSPAIAEMDDQRNNIQHHWVHDAYIVDIATPDVSQKLGHYLAIKNKYNIRIRSEK